MKIKKIKKFILYSGSVYISQFLKGISLVAVKNILGPLGAGQFAFLKLIYRYMTYGHLGIRFAVDKKLPNIYDQGITEEINEFESKSINGIIILQLIFAIIGIVYFALFYQGNIPEYLIYITFLSSIIFSLNEFYKVIYRAEQRTNEMSKYTFYYYLLLSIIQFILAYLYQLNGVIIGIFVVNIVFYLVYFLIVKREKKGLKSDSRFIFCLIKEGFPLFLNGLIVFTFLSVDRWFIIYYFDQSSLGYYSVATMFFGMFMILPNTLSEVLFPDILISIGKKSIDFVVNDVLKKINFLTTIFYLFISIFILLIPYFIHWFMPQYIKSILITQILVVGVFSFAISGLSSYLLIGYDKRKNIIVISGMSLVIAIILDFIFINFLSKNLIYVALASSLTYIIYALSFIINIDILAQNNSSYKDIIRIVFNLIKVIIVVLVEIFFTNELLFGCFLILFIVDCVLQIKYLLQESS